MCDEPVPDTALPLVLVALAAVLAVQDLAVAEDKRPAVAQHGDVRAALEPGLREARVSD